MTDLLPPLTTALTLAEPKRVREAWDQPDPGPASATRYSVADVVWAWLAARAPGEIQIIGAPGVDGSSPVTIGNLTLVQRPTDKDSGWPAGTQLVGFDENTLTVAFPDAEGRPGWTITVDEGLNRLAIQGPTPHAFLLRLARAARLALDAAVPEWEATVAAESPVDDPRYAADLFGETVGEVLTSAVTTTMKGSGDTPLSWRLVDGRPTLDLEPNATGAWTELPPAGPRDQLTVNGSRLIVVTKQPPPPPDATRVFRGRLT